MSGHPSTLRLALVLGFILLGPIAASSLPGARGAVLLGLSWAMAVILLLLAVRRASRSGHRNDRDGSPGDRTEDA